MLEERADQNYIYTLEQRLATEAKTEQERIVDNLYKSGNLTVDSLNALDIDPGVRRQYENLLESKLKLVRDQAAANRKLEAEGWISARLGSLDDGQIRAYLSDLGSGKDVQYWIEKNQEAESDPGNYKKNLTYQYGLDTFDRNMNQMLYVGGKTSDEIKVQENRTIHSKVIREYQRQIEALIDSGVQPSKIKYEEIVNEIMKPYIDATVKKWFEKIPVVGSTIRKYTKDEVNINYDNEQDILNTLDEY